MPESSRKGLRARILLLRGRHRCASSSLASVSYTHLDVYKRQLDYLFYATRIYVSIRIFACMYSYMQVFSLLRFLSVTSLFNFVRSWEVASSVGESYMLLITFAVVLLSKGQISKQISIRNQRSLAVYIKSFSTRRVLLSKITLAIRACVQCAGTCVCVCVVLQKLSPRGYISHFPSNRSSETYS